MRAPPVAVRAMLLTGLLLLTASCDTAVPPAAGAPAAAGAPSRTSTAPAQVIPAVSTSPTPRTGGSRPGSLGPGNPRPNDSRLDGSQPGLAAARLTTGSSGVALTFDDGPDPVNTPKLLDLLKSSGVKATFCVVGSRVRTYPKIVARIAAEGHTLCNHSWQHLEHLYQRDDAYVLRDLNRTNAAIHRAAPGAPVAYFRAPYGNFTPRLVGLARRLGMASLGWNVDDQCYQTAVFGRGPAMVDRMVRRVERGVRPGSVILSHDLDKPHTIVAYRRILPWLTARFRMIPMRAG